MKIINFSLIIISLSSTCLYSQQIDNNDIYSFGFGLNSYNIEDDDLAVFPSEHKKIYPLLEINFSKAKSLNTLIYFPYYQLSISCGSTDRGIYNDWIDKQSLVLNLQGYLGLGFSPVTSDFLLFNIALGLNYLWMAGENDVKLSQTITRPIILFPSNAWEEYWNSLPRHAGTSTRQIKGFPSYSRTAFALNIGTNIRVIPWLGIYFHYTPVFYHNVRHDLIFGICFTGK